MANKNEVAVIEKKINPLVSRAESFKITDEKSMRDATIMLSEMNKIGDQIKAEKEKLTKPLNQALTEIRKRYKPLEEIFERGISTIRKTMGVYQTEQVRIADEEAARIAARVGKGRGKLTPETATRQMEEIDEPERSVATDSGIVKFRTDKNVIVDDEFKVPHKFVKQIIFDKEAIKKELLAGRLVPGCHIDVVQTPVNIR